MKRVLYFLKDYKKECILAPLFKMTEAVFELFVPLVIASMIDAGIRNKDYKVLMLDFGLLALLALIGLTVSITAQYFSAKAATGFATKLRHHLFDHLLQLSFSEIDEVGTHKMITRMTSDVNQAQTGVNMFLRLFLRSPFVVLGAMVMAFTIDVKSAMIFVFAILGLAVIVSIITVKNIQMITKVQGQLELVLRKTRENLTGVRVLRAFCREEKEIQEFYQRNHSLTKEQEKAGGISGFLNPATYILINIAIILLLQTGSIQVSYGVLTQGEVVALYNYMSQILVELVKLANLIVTLSKATASMHRIASVLEQTDLQKDDKEIYYGVEESFVQKGESNNLKLPYLCFEQISLTYRGNAEPSLSNISFSVEKGQTVGVIGGTGSGKSSLMHLLTGFYQPTEGRIRLEGKELQKLPKEELRKKIAIVMQKPVLFSGTIRKNLCFRKKDANDQELMEAVNIAQATNIVSKKGGLDGIVQQNGRNMSGGQRQRLSIARALVGKPEILILDDSSSALDYVTEAKLREAISDVGYRRTTFIVSQRTSTIKHADVILLLEDGILAGVGTHEELLATSEIYREIHESQYKNMESLSMDQ